jgi:hypothetical protein
MIISGTPIINCTAYIIFEVKKTPLPLVQQDRIARGAGSERKTKTKTTATIIIIGKTNY